MAKGHRGSPQNGSEFFVSYSWDVAMTRPLISANSLVNSLLGSSQGPQTAKLGPVVKIELERIEALELLAMTLAHLNDAEARAEMSPRVPLLMTIRDKLARGLREER